MTNKKSLKSALLMSGVSLLLSGAMLVGTTFAWFHDTAESAENTITAGTLDVDLEYIADGDLASATWTSAVGATNVFKTEDTTKWEPGKMVFSKPIRIVNKGTKALKYKITVNPVAEENSLAEVIQYTVIEYPASITVTDREAAWSDYRTDEKNKTAGDVAKEDNSEALAIVLYWQPTESDDEYNDDSAEYTFKFTVDVYATQASSESDSVGNKYDQDAEKTLPAAEKTIQSRKVKKAVETGVTDVNTFNSLMAELRADAAPSEKWVGTLSVDKMTYNEDTQKYESILTFDQMEGQCKVKGICGIVGLLHNAVVEQKDNIDTITINGKVVSQETIASLQALTYTEQTAGEEHQAGDPIELEEDPEALVQVTLMGVVAAAMPDLVEDMPVGGPGWLLEPLLFWAAPHMGCSGETFEQLLKSGMLGKLISGEISGLDGKACDVVITDKLGNAVTYSLKFAVQDAVAP